jgi:hypothetical protein
MAASNGTVGQTGKSRTVYYITRCEKIIEDTGTPVNIDEKDN